MSVQLFLDSIKSPATKKSYNNSLKYYGLDKLAMDPQAAQTNIINFIIACKKEGKSYAAIHNYVAAVLAYYQINDVVLNVRKIGKFMPEHRLVKKDRAWTQDEIGKMLQVADLRMKTVILILASSGCRLGAVPLLKLRNLQDSKLTIYESDKEEYYTFVTHECKQAIDSYLDMRSRYGEKLNDNSPLIREEFNVRITNAKPRHVTKELLTYHLDIIQKRAGVRSKDVALAHGFRKFFTTQVTNLKINPEIREMLLGHKIGLASSYYRPTESDMYAEYEKAIDSLTIDESNKLRREIVQYKSKYENVSEEVEQKILKRLEEKGIKL
jgi:integrase